MNGQLTLEEILAKTIAKQSYAYVFDFDGASIAASATATDTVTTENDSYFLLTGFNAVSFASTAQITAAQVPIMTTQIINTTSGRQFFSAPVYLPLLAGVGQLPGLLPEPMIIPQRTALQMQLTNASAGAYALTMVIMLGVKLFTAQ